MDERNISLACEARLEKERGAYDGMPGYPEKEESPTYFDVQKEYIRGATIRTTIQSDGEDGDDEQETDALVEICVGLWVRLYNKSGFVEDELYYPVVTNTDNFTDDSQEVLEKIKADFPAPEYQNNEW